MTITLNICTCTIKSLLFISSTKTHVAPKQVADFISLEKLRLYQYMLWYTSFGISYPKPDMLQQSSRPENWNPVKTDIIRESKAKFQLVPKPCMTNPLESERQPLKLSASAMIVGHSVVKSLPRFWESRWSAEKRRIEELGFRETSQGKRKKGKASGLRVRVRVRGNSLRFGVHALE